MQVGDQSTHADRASDTPAHQTTLFPIPEAHPLPIRELLSTDQPRNRLLAHGAAALSDAELLAVITGVPCLETTQRLLIAAGGLRGLLTLNLMNCDSLSLASASAEPPSSRLRSNWGGVLCKVSRTSSGRLRVRPMLPTCYCWR